jgi:4-hydroxy-tetrahydrodipicolinate synthase
MIGSHHLMFGRMIPAMVTPFTSTLELNVDAAQHLANYLVEGGSDAIIVCGTTGESPTLSQDEKLSLFAAVKEAVDGRVPVIANIGGNCTQSTIDFAVRADKLGLDGYMCVVPYYNKPPQEGLYQHFKAIANATEMPIILYNIPGRCSVNMTAETTLRLAHDCENIVAIKEASGDFDQVRYIIEHAPEGFVVYSGDDAATLPLMNLGAAGVISTTGNVAPERMKEITILASECNEEAAQYAHDALLPLMKGLFETANPILVKEALNLLGLNVGGVRLPLVPATQAQSERLATIMREVGILS